MDDMFAEQNRFARFIMELIPPTEPELLGDLTNNA